MFGHVGFEGGEGGGGEEVENILVHLYAYQKAGGKKKKKSKK